METNFKFGEPNLGISEEDFDQLEIKGALIESSIDTLIKSNESLSFTQVLETIVNTDVTRDDLSFILASVIFNDFFKTYNESLSMNQNLQTDKQD